MSTEGTGRLEAWLNSSQGSEHDLSEEELATLVRQLLETCETHRRSADSAHYALEQGTLEWVRDRKAMREAVERMQKAEAEVRRLTALWEPDVVAGLRERVKELEGALRFYTEKHPGSIIGGFCVPCTCEHCQLLSAGPVEKGEGK